jgi:hypothetical protein
MWNVIKRWSEQNTDRYLYVPITTPEINPTPLVAERSYYRLWLAEMHLGRSVQWFTEVFPAVQASVQIRWADNEPMTFTRVVRAPSEAQSRGVLMNYPLTELLPFKGGTVEVEAALLAFQGKSAMDSVSASLGILQNVGELVAAPLGQALKVAEAVNKGIDDLVSATDGRVALSLHQAFVSGDGPNGLRAEYIAVILATPGQLDRTRLTVQDNQLLYNGAPFTGYDYMLLRLERRDTRDDWRFSYLDDLMDKIARAYAEDDLNKAVSFEGALKFAIYDSEDFTFRDKKRILWEIKQQLDFMQAEGMDSLPPRPPTIPGIKSLPPQAAPPPSTPPTLNDRVRRRQTFLPESTPWDDIQTPEDLLTIF